MDNEPAHPLKVFLCHASGDKPPVRDLYKRLVAEGVDAWLDKEKLLPGQDWRLEIPKAVQEADVVVVCLSNKSVTKEGYVQKEIKFALDIAEEKPEGAIFLIPARLEECVVPVRLSRWQWVDLYEEDGFVRLLRSLKLRADAVGARIEPSSYEDTDRERERRIKQLYTDGLAAFYTEDWEKAYHRFQSILSEQPNHKNAAEKLAEAEQQRNLAKLYTQASGAIQAGNWQAAIKTLEELSRKSESYKDVTQLLANARKQKRLGELYTEAAALFESQKWQAVVKVFEQISAIEPNYPDPNGLLPSAQKEMAELKRLTDLNDLYARAVEEMDAGRWREARSLLEQVHKAQVNYLETERLLKKVEGEILKEEDKRKQNDQINTLYEQAHGLLRSKKWRNALEKMEEIRRLDERFPDTDGIIEKAQKELAREEQEAESQNQLAAMYAEAVKLLKEEKYQEALDQWQEVKSLDPKYPDRQWVGRTTRKKLGETVQSNPRFSIPRPIWIGVLGFIVIAGILRFVVRPVQDIGNLEVTPTNTIVITAIADRSEPIDLMLYDNFDNLRYEGNYDYTKWGYFANYGSSTPFVQSSGELVADMGKNKTVSINLMDYRAFELSKPTFIESRISLAPNNSASNVWIEFFAYNNGENQGGAWCVISNNPTTDLQDLSCGKYYSGQYQNASLAKKDLIPSWHVIYVGIEPSKMQTVFIVDGEQFGPYNLPNADAFRTYKWYLSMSMYRESIKYPPPTSHIDYVRVGEFSPTK